MKLYTEHRLPREPASGRLEGLQQKLIATQKLDIDANDWKQTTATHVNRYDVRHLGAHATCAFDLVWIASQPQIGNCRGGSQTRPYDQRGIGATIFIFTLRVLAKPNR